jgi:molybdopterin/thiamine biosynthesis adenylyltransferase
MDLERFDRQLLLFGEAGQRRIADAYVTIVGNGGTGSHMAQQLAFLGVRKLGLIDADHATKSSRNRLMGMRPSDIAAETPKVIIAERMIHEIDPEAQVAPVHDTFLSGAGAAELAKASVIFGCMDRDGARLLLNEFACAYDVPYFDLATDTDKDDGGRVTFGGRLMVRTGSDACPYCMDLLDKEAVKRDLTSPERREEEDRLYGVWREGLGDPGPSVVGLNGTLASIAVVEFMVFITGVPRAPKRLLRYDGNRGIVIEQKDAPKPDCPYCMQTGTGDAVDWHRHIRAGLGRWVR